MSELEELLDYWEPSRDVWPWRIWRLEDERYRSKINGEARLKKIIEALHKENKRLERIVKTFCEAVDSDLWEELNKVE